MESPSTTTSSPSGWKIKIRSHSNNSKGGLPSLPSTPLIETDNAFDQRLDLWAQTATFQNIASHICHDVQKDMIRRQQQQQQEQQQPSSSQNQHQQLNDSSHISSSANSPTTIAVTNGNTPNSQPERRRGTMGDMAPFMFDNPSILTDKEYTTWAQNGREVHHPHQWLKLASLFHIHPKTAHQRSLLSPATLQAAKIDRQVSSEVNRKQLEGYLELRRAQNRNYAENAVMEGVKLYNAKNIQEAQEFYKRALDMDPQYAEGWYRVAESLIQQKRTTEAIAQLNKALRIEPTHENAKALLCTLENTSSSYTKTNPLKNDPLLPPTTTTMILEEETNDKESDHRRRKTRDEDSDDENDRQRRKRRRGDSRDSRRRSRRSPSPSHRRSRRSSISPHKSKRSHGYESSTKRSSRHHQHRHHHQSPTDTPGSSQDLATRERDRPSSPLSDHTKGDDNEDLDYHSSKRRRTRDRSPRRSHHKRKDRSSKRSSHHGSSSKRSSRH